MGPWRGIQGTIHTALDDQQLERFPLKGRRLTQIHFPIIPNGHWHLWASQPQQRGHNQHIWHHFQTSTTLCYQMWPVHLVQLSAIIKWRCCEATTCASFVVPEHGRWKDELESQPLSDSQTMTGLNYPLALVESLAVSMSNSKMCDKNYRRMLPNLCMRCFFHKLTSYTNCYSPKIPQLSIATA